MALVGIVLVAINLRTAVAAISPIVDQIRVDIDLSTVGVGVIGSLPPVAFALSGLFGPRLAHRVGLERLLILSIGTMIAGHLLRGAAPSYPMLLVGSLVAFAGIGVANVLLPPLVKRYFPDRVPVLTSVYVMAMAVSTAVPAALAAPVADTAGWRVSLGLWSVLALASLLPWLAVLMQHRRDAAATAAALGADEAPELPVPPRGLEGRIIHSRTAWLIAAIFTMSSVHAYSSFAWLPQLLIDTAGVSTRQAGALLAVYSIAGLPSAFIVPILASRMKNVGTIVQVGLGAFMLGYLGLLIAPAAAPYLWVLLVGFGPLLFPAAIVLINLRTRTANGSVALSGFVQGVGYGVAATGPVLVGFLHTVTGGWTVVIAVALVSVVVCIVPSLLLRTASFVEDEIARPRSRD